MWHQWHGQLIIAAKWSVTSWLGNDELNVQGHHRRARPWAWSRSECVCVCVTKTWWFLHSSDNWGHRNFQTGCPTPSALTERGGGCQLSGWLAAGGEVELQGWGGGPEFTWLEHDVSLAGASGEAFACGWSVIPAADTQLHMGREAQLGYPGSRYLFRNVTLFVCLWYKTNAGRRRRGGELIKESSPCFRSAGGGAPGQCPPGWSLHPPDSEPARYEETPWALKNNPSPDWHGRDTLYRIHNFKHEFTSSPSRTLFRTLCITLCITHWLYNCI